MTAKKSRSVKKPADRDRLVQTRVDRETYEEIRRKAAEDSTSIARIVRLVLRQYARECREEIERA